MAAILPNPAKLSSATRLPPSHARTFSRSRSPSRSPVRKAQFVARELDPLLQNLSPDATLEALQKTNTIAGNEAEQSALAKSISDASESERELGIRGAIAAKTLRQWTEEVLSWPWPTREDRAWGAGFISPSGNGAEDVSHCGSLPRVVVKKYEDRLDEIWDAIETLGMDDLKDYVFSSHNPRRSSISASKSYPSSYGRMRDFTALITAIVIQALPVQANLLVLLDTWSIRLSVLREIPGLLAHFDQVKRALREIKIIIHDPKISPRLTKSELETAKFMFGNKVSYLGKRVDVLLDQLEGQEDSLPQAWLDTLDDIEDKYAEWVAQAEQVVLKNQMLKENPGTETSNCDSTSFPDPSSPPMVDASTPTPGRGCSVHAEKSETTPLASPPIGLLHEPVAVKRKPLTEVNPKANQNHQRGRSDVSAAESAFSGYSLENAEIIDAVETKVMPSPRISVIDHQAAPSRNSVSWLGAAPNPDLSPPRPSALLQRASTASIEIVPKELVKEVVLRRSVSHNLLSSSNQSSRSSLHRATANTNASSMLNSSDHGPDIHLTLPELPRDSLTPLATSPSPSLRVDPLNLKGKQLAASSPSERPIVPRRSSKRLSLPSLDCFEPFPAPPGTVLEGNTLDTVDDDSPQEAKRQETFNDRLKSILAAMPTKIRLTAGSDSGLSSETNSESSTRASSPVQTLKLSPVRDSKSGRYQGTSGIRVYHLSKSGKSRDVPPIKLLVRAVGENGERVMVRVGGGWADLGEYLREYSLHHGGRGLTEGKLEVAGYPGWSASRSSVNLSTGSTIQRGSPNIRSVTDLNKPEPGFDFGLSENDTATAAEPDQPAAIVDHSSHSQNSHERPPPVPLIPPSSSQAAKTPTASPRSTTSASVPQPGSRISVHTSVTPTTTTTTTGNNYTPLGAAGPIQSNRRSTSHTYTRTPPNEAWVNDMMNQARAVSSGHAHHTHSRGTSGTPTSNRSSTVVASPTTTTTTTIMSSRVRGSNTGRTSQRVSAIMSPTAPTPTPAPGGTAAPGNHISPRPSAHSSPIGSQRSKASTGSSGSYATPNTNVSTLRKTEGDGRRRSMMSFSDVGGIRRVFLRKKSEK